MSKRAVVQRGQPESSRAWRAFTPADLKAGHRVASRSNAFTRGSRAASRRSNGYSAAH